MISKFKKDKIKTECILEFFPEQDTFAKAVFSGSYNYLAFAGDVRSGKTICILGILITLCKIYPNSRWVVVRKDLPTLKRTTLPTFNKYCNPSSFRESFNRTDFIYTAVNQSQILFMPESISEDPDLNRFKGFEANGFFLNQPEELSINTFYTTSQRAGQWRIKPMPPALLILDPNPNNTWFKSLFYDPWKEGTLKSKYYFQEAKISKNPHIGDEYIDLQRDTLPPELFKRYFCREWEEIDEAYQLVPFEYIKQCRDEVTCDDETLYMGVDIGWSGSDPTVATILKGYNIIHRDKLDKSKTTESRDFIINKMMQFGIDQNNVVVDNVGIGGGVCDELEEKRIYVHRFTAGEACDESFGDIGLRFLNIRAFAQWMVKEELKHKRAGNFTDQRLISDCRSIKYKISDEKEIRIEDKEQIKKRLGRSPDFWESYYYAVWARIKENFISKPGIRGIN